MKSVYLKNASKSFKASFCATVWYGKVLISFATCQESELAGIPLKNNLVFNFRQNTLCKR